MNPLRTTASALNFYRFTHKEIVKHPDAHVYTVRSGRLQTCASLPYGDGLNCTGSPDAPNEQHFTGKTHDTESGLDYFGAREALLKSLSG